MNVAIYQLKVSKKRVLTVPIEEHAFNYHDAESRDQEEQWQLFRKQVDGLNLLDKGIVMLYLENKTYEEIADIIGLSASNVGTKLSRIKEKLRKQILKQQ
jgi:RNA polymerase sigma-70 factor (ECF subfamily)